MPLKGRKAQPKSPNPAVITGVVVATVVIVGLIMLSTRDAPDEGADAADAYTAVSGLADIHGLAADPGNIDHVYAATHEGLLRGSPDGSWARVGSMRDDLMGFSMHPTSGSTFWTSGHPRSGGNMGVRQSTDGGLSWQTLWDERVDFHAMSVSPADPTRLWGSYGGKLYHSEDGGHAWTIVNANPPPLRTLAADPRDARAIYATTQSGIMRSEDAGATWDALSPIRAVGVALDPVNAGVMYAGGTGALWKSTDHGATWTDLPAPTAGTYAYLSVSAKDPNVLYVGSYETAVHRSIDAGASWTQLHAAAR